MVNLMGIPPVKNTDFYVPDKVETEFNNSEINDSKIMDGAGMNRRLNQLIQGRNAVPAGPARSYIRITGCHYLK